MAQTVNSTVGFGMRPIRHLNGNPWNGATRKYLCEATYGTAMFLGDCVSLTGTAPVSDPSGIYPAVQRTTVGDTPGTGTSILGVITSFDKIDGNGVVYDKVYREATTFRYANVVVDPDVVFIIRDDGSTLLTGDTCTMNANLVEGTGSTATGWSGVELDTASDAPETTNPSNQLLMLGVWPNEDNVLAINCIWEVLISVHAYRVKTGLTGK